MIGKMSIYFILQVKLKQMMRMYFDTNLMNLAFIMLQQNVCNKRNT